LDSYETDFRGVVLATATNYPLLPLNSPVALNLSDSNDLLSWKLGVVFKPTSFGSIYVSYSDSSLPPGGTNFVLADPNAANNTTNINRPGLDPQEATNLEIGTKWDLLDARLSLTFALYRTDNRNEVSITDSVTQEVNAYGKRRVEGAEFGVVGKVTDNWQVIAGLAWSDNEVISGSTGNNAAGSAARWAPKFSGNLWSTYSVGRWTTGLGANYSSDQKRVVDPTQIGTPQNVPEIPGYVVFNGMVGYVVTDWINLQLNVYNLTDKEYISSLNNSGARLRLGVERYAQLTASFKF
jgi:catecholate siderophore receptor